MNETVWEKGIKEGYKQGIELGRKEGLEKGRAQQQVLERRAILREQIEELFGPINAKTDARLSELSFHELKQLGKAILRAESLRDLGLE